MREFRPVPDPSGALQPPNRRPPTAVGCATPGREPGPPPRPSIPSRRKSRRLEGVLEALAAVPVLVMDVLAYPFVRLGRRRRRHTRS